MSGDDIDAPISYTLPERRRAALEEIDNAPFSWFHVRVAVVAGAGFMTDAYDIFAISVVAAMLGYIHASACPVTQPENHPKPEGCTLSPYSDLALKVSTLVGNVIGSIVFGCLADFVGRKKMYGVDLLILLVATFAQAMSGAGFAMNAIVALSFWRFIAGIGIGGDYPTSAVLASEFSSTHIRGRVITAVFASQGWGNFLAAMVALIVVAAHKTALPSDLQLTGDIQLAAIDRMWRILIGLGCVPAAVGLYFRLTIPETPRFTMDIELNLQKAFDDIDKVLTPHHFERTENGMIGRVELPRASIRDLVKYFSEWPNLKVMIGTCWSWFALDFAFYGLGLNSVATVITAIPGYADPSMATAYTSLLRISVANLVISVVALVPGYWISFLVIDKWGRKPLQYMGFLILTAIFLGMGFGYDSLVPLADPKSDATASDVKASPGFVALYCLAIFFCNFGPNVTTFVIAAEVFPTRYRSTAHGISAAVGKLGAISAQCLVSVLSQVHAKDGDPRHALTTFLKVIPFVVFTGVFSTMLIPEPNQRSLEELSSVESKRPSHAQEASQVTQISTLRQRLLRRSG